MECKADREASSSERSENACGLNAQLASERELRAALELDLDVSRCAVAELKQVLAETRGE